MSASTASAAQDLVLDDEGNPVTYPGAQAPDRVRDVDAGGVRIAVHEWGDASASPLLLAHGGFDFARTLSVFAPLLAAGGWRVVAWDQRGHGDSAHAGLYSWEADVRDAMAVLRSVAGEDQPVPLVGHSKGGALMMSLAESQPHRVAAIVNLDGLPSHRRLPDVPDQERARMLSRDTAALLDHRRRAATLARRPGTLDELARRRARMNPRLPIEWLRYLVTVGARRDPDGWRWKIDPALRLGAFGPWRPEWMLWRMPAIAQPFLGVLGLDYEDMGWGTRPADVEPWLPAGARFVTLPETGHFIHVERPDAVAGLVLEFLADVASGAVVGPGAGGTAGGPVAPGPVSPGGEGRSRPPVSWGSGRRDAVDPALGQGLEPDADGIVWLRHNKIDLALHRLAEGEPGTTPVLWLHGLGERAPAAVPAVLEDWPGAVWALDFTGHGRSTVPAAGGYSCEALLGDADHALARLGPSVLVGRGLGAYVALLAAGTRPELVRAAVLDDGPGLWGGGPRPGSAVLVAPQPGDVGPPDPWALVELARDPRPPDYAATFARVAVEGSDLHAPLVVAARMRPPWLEEVVGFPGVEAVALDEGLRHVAEELAGS